MAKQKNVRLSRSIRKHLREEKARIRRDSKDAAVVAQKITELYAKFGLKARV